MMNLFVDPVLLAVPQPGEDPTQNTQVQEEYTSCLRNWSAEISHKNHRFFMSGECISALYEDGCFPEIPVLKRCLKMCGMEDSLSVDAIFKVAAPLATNTPHLEDFFPGVNLRRIDVEDATFFIHPDLLKRLPPAAAAAFKRSLAKIAWLRANRGLLAEGAPDPGELLLVTHPVENETTTSIRADVLADDLVTVENELPLVTHPDDLARFTGLAQLWDRPTEAIQWLWKRHKSPKPDLVPYYIAPDFIESIKHYNYHNNPGWLEAIYRKCFQLLSCHQFEGSKHHKFGHPPKTDGLWVAWRLHVTGPPSSIRLHYWRYENRIILMNIFSSGEHNENEGMIGPPPPQAFSI